MLAASDNASIASDLLKGADEIAAFMFGSRTKRRRIYHLVAHSKLPIFRLGDLICSRRSTLLAWISEQERLSATKLGNSK
jgi:hypothetical protein